MIYTTITRAPTSFLEARPPATRTDPAALAAMTIREIGDRADGAARVRRSRRTLRYGAGRRLQPPGAVPGRDRLLQSPAGLLARPRHREARSTGRRSGCGSRKGSIGSFQGTAKVFQESLAAEPILILAAIVAVYIILGMLYESLDPSALTILSTPPLSGRGGPPGAPASPGTRSRSWPLDRDRPPDRDCSEEETRLMMHRLRAGGAAQWPRGAAAGTGDPPRLHRALPPDHDDDNGRALRSALPLALEEAASARSLHKPLGISIVGGLILSQSLTLFTTPRDLRDPGPAAASAPGPEAAPVRAAAGVLLPGGSVFRAEGSMNISAPFIQRPVATLPSWRSGSSLIGIGSSSGLCRSPRSPQVEFST